MRMVTGSTGSTAWAANMEIKCFDLLANPYLLLSGVLAAGLAGMDGDERLPAPVDVDPAAMDESVLADRGIARLPTSLREAVDAFAADPVLGRAFGAELVSSIIAVRESEMGLFADASDAEIADATRWAH